MSALWVLALAVGAAECEAARGLPADAAEAACRLVALPAPVPSAEPSALGAIYQRPEFKQARDRVGGAWDVLWRRLSRWLGGLLGSAGALGYAEATRLAVLVAAAVAGLLVLLRALAARTQRRARPGGAEAAPSALALEDAATHLARARSASSPRAAIREALLALLSALERARLARPDRVKTNLELVGELTARGASPPVVERVGALLAWYDAAWYSLEPVAPAAAEGFLRGVEEAAGQLTEGR